jgi:hypothetical protein
VGQDTLGSAFSGAVQQFVEVLAAQEEHVLDERRLLLFRFGHCGLQKCETRLVDGFLVGTKMGNQMAMPALQPVAL